MYAIFLIVCMRGVTSPNALRGCRSVTTYALACSESSFYEKFAVEEDVLLLLPSKGDFRSSSSFIERIVAVCCQSEADCLRFGDLLPIVIMYEVLIIVNSS